MLIHDNHHRIGILGAVRISRSTRHLILDLRVVSVRSDSWHIEIVVEDPVKCIGAPVEHAVERFILLLHRACQGISPSQWWCRERACFGHLSTLDDILRGGWLRVSSPKSTVIRVSRLHSRCWLLLNVQRRGQQVFVGTGGGVQIDAAALSANPDCCGDGSDRQP